MNILVTGGYGFIGANFILYWLSKYPNDKVINVDLCTYAAVKLNLKTVETSDRYFMVKADIADYETMEQIVEQYEVDYIVNFAAESHNSNSTTPPSCCSASTGK